MTIEIVSTSYSLFTYLLSIMWLIFSLCWVTEQGSILTLQFLVPQLSLSHNFIIKTCPGYYIWRLHVYVSSCKWDPREFKQRIYLRRINPDPFLCLGARPCREQWTPALLFPTIFRVSWCSLWPQLGGATPRCPSVVRLFPPVTLSGSGTRGSG